MKFLLHGNAPWAATGYGVQIGYLAERLLRAGHEVACSATYGLQGGVQDWHGIRVYGCGFDYQSNDLVHHHAAHWFGGDPGWIIICTDVWAIENPLDQFNVAAWVPIDHYSPLGAQPNVAQFFERSGAVPIAMSRFGEEMLRRRGLDPIYVPLAVDTRVYKPTPTLEVGGDIIPARKMLDIARPIGDESFVVGMVAMNKGWAKDRKGFNEAFRGFALFNKIHPEADAHLFVHAEALGGAEGINLIELAVFSGIPEHKIHWSGGPGQYGYRLGYTAEMMAAVYTGMDVLLAPGHGEGFCVPIIEAHACGTPVIATDFAAQTELVPEGTGWLVDGQPEWDPPHHAEYLQPYIADVLTKLEMSWEADRASMAAACIAHAAEYDAATVFAECWVPAIEELGKGPDALPLDREPMPHRDAVAVLCPIYRRTENIPALVESFSKNTEPGTASLYFVIDGEDVEPVLAAVPYAGPQLAPVADVLEATRGESRAQKWNAGLEQTTEPWVLCIGDDVLFGEGWLDAAREASEKFDVIGTNDTAPGKPVKNRKVANGSHADHFFVRRDYVTKYGASLDGPGSLAPEEYRHWYVDMEIVGLARARGVFAPCLGSVVEHLHPGYDGDEEAREGDPTYMVAVANQSADHAKWMERLPLVEMQRTTRGRL